MQFGNQAVSRDGFTVIELFVVLAVIGTLVGVTLPAVNSVRESARIAACQNNLRSLALAFLGYESAHRSFPTGQEAPIPSEVGWEPVDWAGHSGLGHLWHVLPYLEQESMFKGFSENAISHRFWATPTGIAATESLSIPSLRCPSDVSSDTKHLFYSNLTFPPYQVQSTLSHPVDKHDGWTSYLGSRGVPRYFFDKKPVVHTGIFFEGSATRPSDILDGLSQTILTGEVLGGTTYDIKPRIVDSRHSIFQNGIGHYQFFFDQTDDLIDDLSSMFASRHLGGHLINFSFSDGHVESKSSEVDIELLWSLTTRAGVY